MVSSRSLLSTISGTYSRAVSSSSGPSTIRNAIASAVNAATSV